MNVFIVDDHPLTVIGYITCLKNVNCVTPINFIKAYNCQEGYTAINAAATEQHFDLAIVDEGLPDYKEENLCSGSDLALLIRKRMPACKILIITAHTEILIIYEIFKKIKPEGLLIKSDITAENLPLITVDILAGKTFQSVTVKKNIQEIWKKELMIDDANRQILLHLAIGYKVKELPQLIALSISPIQRRIAQMKEAFGVAEASSLVKEAKLQGYI